MGYPLPDGRISPYRHDRYGSPYIVHPQQPGCIVTVTVADEMDGRLHSHTGSTCPSAGYFSGPFMRGRVISVIKEKAERHLVIFYHSAGTRIVSASSLHRRPDRTLQQRISTPTDPLLRTSPEHTSHSFLLRRRDRFFNSRFITDTHATMYASTHRIFAIIFPIIYR